MVEFNRHKHRNKTNRNIITIAIGFLCALIAGGFAFQNFMQQTRERAKNIEHILHIAIDNNSKFTNIPYTLIVGKDTALSKTIENSKNHYEIAWKWNSPQQITNYFGSTNSVIDSVIVTDSISYLMITIKNDVLNRSKIEVNSKFFE